MSGSPENLVEAFGFDRSKKIVKAEKMLAYFVNDCLSSLIDEDEAGLTVKIDGWWEEWQPSLKMSSRRQIELVEKSFSKAGILTEYVEKLKKEVGDNEIALAIARIEHRFIAAAKTLITTKKELGERVEKIAKSLGEFDIKKGDLN